MTKLRKHHLEFIEQAPDTMSDRQIAQQLGVAAKHVRKVRRQLPVARSQPRDRPDFQPRGFVGRALEKTDRFVNHKVFVWFGLLLLCGISMYIMMKPVFCSDFGWHAALGRYIVENGVVPKAEPLSHTARGFPMIVHEWLSQAAYHLIIRATGVLGLRWVHAAIVGAMLLWLFTLFRQQGVRPAMALLGVYVYIVVAHERFQHRPHMFHMALFMAMYGCVFVWKPSLSLKQLIGIFVVVVMWANAHSAVILFAAIVVLYLAVEFAQQKSGWRKPLPGDLGGGDLGRLGALAFAVVTAVLLTPNHVRLFPYILESKRLNSLYSEEWQSILQFAGHSRLEHSVLAFAFVGIASVVLCLKNIRRESLSVLCVVLILTLIPLTGFRFISVAFVPTLFVLSATTSTGALTERKRNHGARAWLGRLSSSLAVMLILATIYTVLWPKVSVFRHRLSADWDFQKAIFPIAAVDFLDVVNLDGRIFNPPKWGGYILLRTYQKYPVFFDGRWVAYGEKIYQDTQEILRGGHNAEALLEEYEVDILLVYREYITADDRDKNAWVPVFENYNSGVYLRNSRRNAENLRKCAEYYASRGVPFDLQEGFNAQDAYAADRDWAKSMYIMGKHFVREQ
ncbi:MAG: hypothetical protein JSU63_16000 [Phycisphaerales bacterium]|nr:MAG: hypothetical protein JSU63_16000 [Phycisphaerales bacterium]